MIKVRAVPARQAYCSHVRQNVFGSIYSAASTSIRKNSIEIYSKWALAGYTDAKSTSRRIMPSQILVDPPALADGSIMFIFDIDTMSTTTLYAAGGSRDEPVYSLTSNDNVKHSVLRRGAASSEEIVGVVDYNSSLKLARGKYGTVTIGSREPLPLEEWMHIRAPTKDVVEAVVVIDEQEYVWTARIETSGKIKYQAFEVRT
jgi:hypothetical protein